MPIDTSAPDQLRQQLLEKYPQSPQPGGSPMEKAALLTALRTLHSAGDMQQSLLDSLADASNLGSEDFSLSGPDTAILGWIDETFRIALNESNLDPLLAVPMRKLLPLVAAIAITDDQFLEIGDHPLHQLIDTIYSRCTGWHDGLGRGGSSVLALVEDTSTQALKYFKDQAPDFAQLQGKLEQSLDLEIPSFERIQERVIETERGRLKAQSARVTAGRAINDFMRGKVFPAEITEFLQGPWFDSLQLILIMQGPESQAWSRALLVTDTLVWTMQPCDLSDEDHRQRLYKVIPKIPRELRQLLVSLKNDNAATESALATIEDIHFGLLRSRPPKFQSAPQIDLGPTATRTRVSKHMLQQIEALDAGQWFVIEQGDGKELRAQLALKLDDYGQLLFVNGIGARALSKSFEEFAFLLSNRRAHHLSTESVFSRSLQLAAGDILVKQDVAEDGEEEMEFVDFEVVDFEVVDFELAAEPDPAAAEDVEDVAVAEDVEDASSQEGEPALETLPGQAVLDRLAIGSWVLFKSETGNTLCKLAVRITGKDQFLFVNNRGKRQHELNSAELRQLIEDNQLELVEEKSSFEDAVSNLVRNFRDNNTEEAQE